MHSAAPGQHTDSPVLHLTSLAVGSWYRYDKKAERILLLLPTHQRQSFVLVVEGVRVGSLSWASLLQNPKGSIWHKSSREQGNRCTLTFEIPAASIVGLDYSNPLCQEGRVVFEVVSAARRQFKSVEEVRCHYALESCRPATVPEGATRKRQQLNLDICSAGTAPHPQNPETNIQEPQTDPCQTAPIGISACTQPPPRQADAADSSKCYTRTTALQLDASCTALSQQASSPSSGQTPSWPEQQLGYRTVALSFRDSSLPAALCPLVEGDERLLKLYESGLPTWAIYMPRYGLPYRPWMRWLTWALFVAIATSSLIIGFWDLYKHMPYLEQVVRSLHLPSTAIMRWLDTHLTMRLSILFAFLFGKSQLAAQLLRWLAAAGTVLRSVLQPLLGFLRPAAHLLQDLWGWIAACAATGLTAILASPLSGILAVAVAILKSFAGLLQILWSTFSAGPMWMFSTSATFFNPAWEVACQAAAGLVVLWQAVSQAAAVTRQVPASDMNQGALWAWQAYWDAWGMVRLSGLKVFRALQTVWRTIVLVCMKVAKHRLTLSIRMRRHWHRTRHKALQASRRMLQHLRLCWRWSSPVGVPAAACDSQPAPAFTKKGL